MLSALYDRLPLLCLALGIDAACGEMGLLFRALPHPVVLAGRAIGWCDHRLNRPADGAARRRAAGVLIVLGLVGLAGAAGWALHRLCRGSVPGAAAEAFAAAVLLAQRSLFDHVADVGRALSHDGIDAARVAVARIVGRDPARLDAAAVARAAIESLAENFSDGVVAPALWYLAAGLPGLLAYKMANTLDSMIGHNSERHRAFGWAAARFDDLLNLIPAPLSGLLIVAAAAFGPDTRPAAALRIMRRDARKHRSPNAGWPEAAMAGALGLALAGPRHYAAETVDDPFLGDGTPNATAADIGRALRLYVRACMLLAALSAGAWLAPHLTRPW
ncbi:MAG: cobalamin biosynthesis protein [Alphaproteobacteria bacterium]|nr:cobalamin biosynthesis protein [Alphaproteobacteria bacterium]